MTDPQQDDLTADDLRVEPTGNGLTADDPADQPPQDPDWMPPGTITGSVRPPAGDDQ